MNTTEEEKVVNQPDGRKLRKTLVQLLADQEGIKITYVLEYRGERETVTTK